MDGKKRRESQELYVVKANELIQKGRYNLTTQQQKLILFAISKIKKGDNYDQWYEMSIEEACAVMGLDLDSGGFYYRSLKSDFMKLTRRQWVSFDDGSEGTVSWLSDAYIIPLSGTVQVKFHEKLAPYLFDLVNRYTQYQLYEVLVFKNKYAIRLYEIMRSYLTQDELRKGTEKDIVLRINDLREQLCTPQYEKWNDLNRFCIKPAIQEINKLSDIIRIEYRPLKTGGRSFEKIMFTITYPNLMEKFAAHEEQRRRL
jgi:plasmid replication initiation protein